jgi:arylsulfate sulfotransferase
MNKIQSRPWIVVSSVVFLILAFAPGSRAVTILSPPSFTPAAKAPLAGVLELTTDVASRVHVLVSDGSSIWEKDFYDFATTHSETLLGFKPGRTNVIQVTVIGRQRNVETAPQLLTFVTAPLPANFPHSVVLTSEPDQMEPGYTLFMVQNRNLLKNYITIMDKTGEVVWYAPAPNPNDADVRQMDNGDLFIVDSYNKRFLEMNMLGQTVETWNPPSAYPINLHDGVITDRGTILYLSDVSRTVSNFPSSSTVPNAPLKTVTIDDNPIVEISMTNGALLNVWSPLDMLDPTHFTYLTYASTSPFGVDNEHANAIIEDTSDDSIIVSLRDQNAVFKFARSTGQVKWILGPPANWSPDYQQYLLTPVGTPFEWNYAQHAPMLTPQGTLLVYDDGNYRASPFDSSVADQDNYSRAVEFGIDETNMEVSQVWESPHVGADRLYTGILGKAQWLPQRRNVLATYGYVTYINGISPSPYSANATMVRVREFTHDPVPQVVFDLSFFDYDNTSSSYLGYIMYRALRIPDLYAHPFNSEIELVVSEENGTPYLQFSADPARTYVIQASTDLISWTTVGTAVQEDQGGDYGFYDLNANQFGTRFYRAVTE